MTPIIATFWAIHREKILYLFIGGWNTIFGFGLFWLLHTWLHDSIHYLVLLIFTNEASILNAFVGYRWIVFRSRGSVLGELLRFHGVYLAAMLAGLALTAGLVELAGMPPVGANGLSIIVTVISSYFGHRRFSFR